MKNILLASTSSLFGEAYLAYLTSEISSLFDQEVIFIPYARPGGISHDDYTVKAAEAFAALNIKLTGLHTYADPQTAIRNAAGFFTGGGNTFLLVKQLHELDLMDALRASVEKGIPYLGTSAGSNIAGVSMQTTNDMPIVYPPSFQTLGLVPFNLNPHYLDPDPTSKHNGETRETRIREFHTQNSEPVIGLREGNWIRVLGEKITVEGRYDTRIFEPNKPAYEVPPGTLINFSGL
ncbi:dipeptidase E [Mucilaginibacter sp. PPCGB 2223]|uniref:dipeptidase PepE n=1 Tax=Mucilaginibacter sp. PPCGB 2223 TaxID=1886027 RepID=UPI000825C3CF|nr:dipeptidase PepE [Mucilaginibacter sp. PPCGB 2223]OCX54343.1 dipeptidase E [Mucilaginibacter sp. PPCGB 2223]